VRSIFSFHWGLTIVILLSYACFSVCWEKAAAKLEGIKWSELAQNSLSSLQRINTALVEERDYWHRLLARPTNLEANLEALLWRTSIYFINQPLRASSNRGEVNKQINKQRKRQRLSRSTKQQHTEEPSVKRRVKKRAFDLASLSDTLKSVHRKQRSIKRKDI